MSTDVIVAIIAGCCTIIGVVITSVVTARKTNTDVLSQLHESQALMNQRIDELTREVRVHNDFASRIPTMDEKISTLEREMGEVRESTGMKGGKKS